MPRELVDVSENTLVISDAISGGTVAFRYRLPSTEERVEYRRDCLRKDEENDTVVFDADGARQKHGMNILTGIREGDFTAAGTPVSSDPESDHYRPDWKDLVAETASDLVAALAMTVFENVRQATSHPGKAKGGEGARRPLPRN